MSEGALGWAGKVLRVDLTTGRVRMDATRDYADEMVGGRGISQLVLWRELDPPVDPLGPGNKLILGIGPLGATLAPASGRLCVDFLSPLTGGVGSSNVGGHLGPELKYAGFDQVIIEGQATAPVYLLIVDGRAEIRDARPIWGMTTWEAERALREELGDPHLRVGAIGPAGENQVRGACLMVDRGRAAGRGGAGAVMGAKRLKAIAVRGTRPIRVANPQGFLAQVRVLRSRFERSYAVGQFRAMGTHGRYDAGYEDGSKARSVRNCQDEYWPPGRCAQVTEAACKRFEVRRLACFNCPAYCSHFYCWDDGTCGEGMEANAVRAFGENLDIADPRALFRLHVRANQLGLDCDMASTLLAFTMELYQRGLVSTRDLDGVEPTWGNGEAALALLEQMAYRRGFGNILAEGPRRAAEIVGGKAGDYVLHIKGASLNESKMRIDKAWALGIMTSVRGGGHLDGAPGGGCRRISDEVAQATIGVPHVPEVVAYGTDVVRLVLWHEKLKALVDMTGLCYLTSLWSDFDLLGPDDYASLLALATGVERSGEELMRLGEKLHNVERAFNALHAKLGRGDDRPPRRLLEAPVAQGPWRGQRLDAASWDKMLDDYYALQGWDVATGRPVEASLQPLGLGFVVEKLKHHGIL